MASSGKIIKGLDEFLVQMKTLRQDDVFRVLRKSQKTALTLPQGKLAGLYASFNKATVWARIWGRTQNSWLIEHGRYKDPSRAYRGWKVFEKFFQTYGRTIHDRFTDDVGKGFDRVFKRITSEMNKASR